MNIEINLNDYKFEGNSSIILKNKFVKHYTNGSEKIRIEFSNASSDVNIFKIIDGVMIPWFGSVNNRDDIFRGIIGEMKKEVKAWSK